MERPGTSRKTEGSGILVAPPKMDMFDILGYYCHLPRASRSFLECPCVATVNQLVNLHEGWMCFQIFGYGVRYRSSAIFSHVQPYFWIFRIQEFSFCWKKIPENLWSDRTRKIRSGGPRKRRNTGREPSIFVKVVPTWVCLKMLCTPKPNGFADHEIPFLNGYFIGGIAHFQTNPLVFEKYGESHSFKLECIGPVLIMVLVPYQNFHCWPLSKRTSLEQTQLRWSLILIRCHTLSWVASSTTDILGIAYGCLWIHDTNRDTFIGCTLIFVFFWRIQHWDIQQEDLGSGFYPWSCLELSLEQVGNYPGRALSFRAKLVASELAE